ncbi:hypothetical protein VB776_19625 [Arcicella sp. DC2W]|uniref:Uncharacterized protein n=1 Tax=Arcicella gelida TaxID=2984195 RepID=A0ABU5S9L5_9BACT|nr:hypothetical protein [Arcicella sp. DC2W]MEA5405155.1 hypothetical protein [Arcicella sp. DC2W]
MKTSKPQTEQKSHKVPKKKKSLWELANESTVPEGWSGLINILAPYELPKKDKKK